MKKSTTTKTKNTVADTNKAFWKLPKDKQRVIVAKDVIKQLIARRFNPTKGTYFEADFNPDLVKESKNDLQTLFKKSEMCSVCGIGACFVSLVNVGDKAKISDYGISGEYMENIDDEKMRKFLRKVFDSEQITLIEAAFEKYHVTNDYGICVDPDTLYRAENFSDITDTTYDSHERLIKIMENIIANKGTFIP